MKKTIFFRCLAAVFFPFFMLLILPSAAFPGKSPAAIAGRVICHPSGFTFTKGARAGYSLKKLIKRSNASGEFQRADREGLIEALQITDDLADESIVELVLNYAKGRIKDEVKNNAKKGWRPI